MGSTAELTSRKEPVQQRSKERVARMLAAACEIIGEQGSDAMKMGEVAERAGVSIGSLYQFFPDKGAIIQTLAEQHVADGRACIDAAFAGISTRDGLARAFSDLIDAYYDVFLASPVARDVWSGMQADKTLREIELGYSRASAQTLVEAIRRVDPSIAEAETTAFLVWQLGEATMRLAVSVPRAEGDRMIEVFKRMALGQLEALLG